MQKDEVQESGGNGNAEQCTTEILAESSTRSDSGGAQVNSVGDGELFQYATRHLSEWFAWTSPRYTAVDLFLVSAAVSERKMDEETLQLAQEIARQNKGPIKRAESKIQNRQQIFR
jgi:hypothetical protein